jgi:hypothetical protein
MILQVLRYVYKRSCFKRENKPNMERFVFPWCFAYCVYIVRKTRNGHTMYALGVDVCIYGCKKTKIVK